MHTLYFRDYNYLCENRVTKRRGVLNMCVLKLGFHCTRKGFNFCHLTKTACEKGHLHVMKTDLAEKSHMT